MLGEPPADPWWRRPIRWRTAWPSPTHRRTWPNGRRCAPGRSERRSRPPAEVGAHLRRECPGIASRPRHPSCRTPSRRPSGGGRRLRRGLPDELGACCSILFLSHFLRMTGSPTRDRGARPDRQADQPPPHVYGMSSATAPAWSTCGSVATRRACRPGHLHDLPAACRRWRIPPRRRSAPPPSATRSPTPPRVWPSCTRSLVELDAEPGERSWRRAVRGDPVARMRAPTRVA